MRSLTKYTIAGVITSLFLIIILSTAWLFGTTQGAQFILNAADRWTSLRIENRSISGTLCKGVIISDFRLSWADGTARIQELNIRWNPVKLLSGRVSIQRLSVRGLRIQDARARSTEKSSDGLSWPGISGPLTRLKLHIDEFAFIDAMYRRLDEAPIAVTRASAIIDFSFGTLELGNLDAVLPQARVTGEVLAGLVRPSLNADLKVHLSNPVAGMEHMTFATDVAQTADALAEGKLQFTAAAGSKPRVSLNSGITITSRTAALTGLRLTVSGNKGEVTGRAEFGLDADAPEVHADLAFHNLDLSAYSPFLTRVNGRIGVSGTRERYAGKLEIANKGPMPAYGAVRTDFRGTPDSLTATGIRAEWLGGKLTGTGTVSWGRIFASTFEIKARGLQPDLVDPAWNGAINVNLSGRVRMHGSRPPEASLEIRILQSLLQGEPFTGEVSARMARNNLSLNKLFLSGRGFSLQGHGRLKEGITFSAGLSDLSVYVPDSGGSLLATGLVKSDGSAFSGSLALTGKNLILNQFQTESLRLKGSLIEERGFPFSLNLSLGNCTYSLFHADSVTLEVKGTPKAHNIDVRLSSLPYSLESQITGEYNAEMWQGSVHFSGNDPAGQWQSREPAAVVLSPGRLSLSKLVITSIGREQVELSAAAVLSPLSGSANVLWHQIDLSRVSGWLAGASVSGTSSGTISGTVLSPEQVSLTGSMSLDSAILRRRIQNTDLEMELKKAELRTAWQGQKLTAQLAVVLAQYGSLEAGLEIAVPARLPVSLVETTGIEAFVKGGFRENGILSFLFPGLVQETRGDITLDMKLAGTWNKPELKGSFSLNKAAALFPAAGIRIEDVKFQAALAKNILRIQSLSARSGPGMLQANAEAVLEGWTVARYEGTLQGDRFQSLFLPRMQMTVSPSLSFRGTMQKLVVRGEAKIPEFLISGPPREAPVKASEDVVIVSRPREDERDSRFMLDLEVKVILGERVIVKAEGADASLTGQVVVTASSPDDVLARGEISIAKGKYSAYGVGLDITRGRVLFAGGPVENPSLDILAVKTVDEVKAGVHITGTATAPVVRLYSQPAMPDADVLAYMVLGHPLGQDREQGTYLMQAAGALLSAGQSVALQDQVKQRLRLDTIDIQTGGGEVSRSLITVGKYLSSKLYISYGRSLFTGENQFRMRYKFGKRLELESQSGETSGIDLYYTIRMD